MVVLQANKDGSRVVSGKFIGERSNPVIDINSRDLLAILIRNSSHACCRQEKADLLAAIGQRAKEKRPQSLAQQHSKQVSHWRSGACRTAAEC